MPYFAPYIDGTGLHMPTYEDRLSDLMAAFESGCPLAFSRLCMLHYCSAAKTV